MKTVPDSWPCKCGCGATVHRQRGRSGDQPKFAPGCIERRGRALHAANEKRRRIIGNLRALNVFVKGYGTITINGERA